MCWLLRIPERLPGDYSRGRFVETLIQRFCDVEYYFPSHSVTTYCESPLELLWKLFCFFLSYFKSNCCPTWDGPRAYHTGYHVCFASSNPQTLDKFCLGMSPPALLIAELAYGGRPRETKRGVWISRAMAQSSHRGPASLTTPGFEPLWSGHHLSSFTTSMPMIFSNPL